MDKETKETEEFDLNFLLDEGDVAEMEDGV